MNNEDEFINNNESLKDAKLNNIETDSSKDFLKNNNEFIKFTNKNHQDSKFFEEAMKESLKPSKPIEYKKKKKTKNKGFKKILASVAFLLSLSATFKLGKEYQIKSNEIAINNELKDNLDIISMGQYWDFNAGVTADNVLNSNEYDIDTRIYGVYDSLSNYNKVPNMDELFSQLNEKVSTGNYSIDIINSCSFDTFKEYLDSKGLSKEEYEIKMSEIKRAYAENDNNKLAELLESLNKGVSR